MQVLGTAIHIVHWTIRYVALLVTHALTVNRLCALARPLQYEKVCSVSVTCAMCSVSDVVKTCCGIRHWPLLATTSTNCVHHWLLQELCALQSSAKYLRVDAESFRAFSSTLSIDLWRTFVLIGHSISWHSRPCEYCQHVVHGHFLCAHRHYGQCM